MSLRKLLFSLCTFVAAAAVLMIAFEASLPRPWWALLTVFVTAQPMAGATRPKALYRLAGIATGAVATIVLVPNLQNSPVLLVLCLALWTSFCIYLAVLDRTPRAFLFQMAAFSSAVISFPYLYDPSDIFSTTVSRFEEMTVAILCVTAAHSVLKPQNVRPVLRDRAHAVLARASSWASKALSKPHTELEYKHRRMLAADVTELGMIAFNLASDWRYALATRATVTKLQHRLANLLPIASAAANRLDRLHALNAIDSQTAALVESVIGYLDDSRGTAGPFDKELAGRCRTLAAHHIRDPRWTSLLAASLCDRMAEFVDTLHAARELACAFDAPAQPATGHFNVTQPDPGYSLARDHGLALLAGVATAAAIMLYCTFWIVIAWPSGIATAAFAALITCSFSSLDDPAPFIWRYLTATIVTFPLAALYLFVILPRVDGAGMLIVTLAPTLLAMGYLQADPSSAPRALPMLGCFIVAMGFLDRFQADLAGFMNTGLAQVGGIVTTLAVTKLFRSAQLNWTAWRIVRRNWADLERMADPRLPLRAQLWTAQALDRLGQIAARLALVGIRDSLHAADALVDLRIGRNLIQIRRELNHAQGSTQRALETALLEVSALYRARMNTGAALAGAPALLGALDQAIDATLAAHSGLGSTTLLALVGMRCNLFPDARPLEIPPS